MWDLPGPGLKPVSPALAGGFSTTAPPGKSVTPVESMFPPGTSLWERLPGWLLSAHLSASPFSALHPVKLRPVDGGTGTPSLAGVLQVQPMGGPGQERGGWEKRERGVCSSLLSAGLDVTVLTQDMSGRYDSPCWASLPPHCQPALKSGGNTVSSPDPFRPRGK